MGEGGLSQQVVHVTFVTVCNDVVLLYVVTVRVNKM